MTPIEPRGVRARRLRAAGSLLLLASLPAVLGVTLFPSDTHHYVAQPLTCVLCGRFGLSNVLRNVILFAPFGLGLGLRYGPVRWVWIVPALLSLAIETVQMYVPGRNPLLVDVAANGAGGVLGVMSAWVAMTWLGTGHRLPYRLEARGLGRAAAVGAASLAATGALLGTGLAFRPAPPDPPYHVEWNPRLGSMDPYRGTVLDARLGDAPLPPGRYTDPAPLREALFAGRSLSITFRARTPPESLAPLLAIRGRSGDEMLLVGVEGDDLVLRPPLLAGELRLDHPDLRLAGAVPPRPGVNTVRADARLTPDGVCLSSGPPMAAPATESCGLRPTLGEGWALLLFPGGASVVVKRLLDLLWLGALGAFPGFFAARRAELLFVTLGLPAVAWMTPAWTGSLGSAPPWQLLVLVAAGLLGHACAAWATANVDGRSRPTFVAGPQHRNGLDRSPDPGRRRGPTPSLGRRFGM